MDCSKNSDHILETDRLLLRKLTQDDFSSLCLILQDEEVMYAYEHAFSDQEVHEWLDRQLSRYQQNGLGLLGVILKETGELIGQCGITLQECHESMVHEVGYLFRRSHWHQGFATEAALACRDYAFQSLGTGEVYAIIRDTNTASKKVAERLGMTLRGSLMKHYWGVDMPHDIFSVRPIPSSFKH